MEKIGVVVDSSSSLSPQYIEEKNIGLISFTYTLDGVTKREGIDETSLQYYKRLKNSTDFPKTSQPAIGEYIRVIENYREEYDQVLVFPLSTGLSGSFQTANLVTEGMENVYVVDTRAALDNTRFMVERSFKLIEEGLKAGEIKEKIEGERDQYGVLLVANDLDYLRRGGRIPSAIAKMGDVLNIKPIIDMNKDGDGQLGLKDIVRGRKRTLKKMVRLIPPDVKRMAIGDVNSPEIREILETRIAEAFPHAEITRATVTPVIASHIGPSCYGLFYSFI